MGKRKSFTLLFFLNNNTMILMAFVALLLIPVLGLIGGGISFAKTRLPYESLKEKKGNSTHTQMISEDEAIKIAETFWRRAEAFPKDKGYKAIAKYLWKEEHERDLCRTYFILTAFRFDKFSLMAYIDPRINDVCWAYSYKGKSVGRKGKKTEILKKAEEFLERVGRPKDIKLKSVMFIRDSIFNPESYQGQEDQGWWMVHFARVYEGYEFYPYPSNALGFLYEHMGNGVWMRIVDGEIIEYVNNHWAKEPSTTEVKFSKKEAIKLVQGEFRKEILSDFFFENPDGIIHRLQFQGKVLYADLYIVTPSTFLWEKELGKSWKKGEESRLAWVVVLKFIDLFKFMKFIDTFGDCYYTFFVDAENGKILSTEHWGSESSFFEINLAQLTGKLDE
ncbi:TPA: hypothetical protein DCX15_03405 [bacterium]|nr:hypothetical protein [bacterium]